MYEREVAMMVHRYNGMVDREKMVDKGRRGASEAPKYKNEQSAPPLF